MKLFYLERCEDISGISGCGRVAAGVVFPNQKAVVCWIVGEVQSITIYDNIEQVIKIHGHENRTKVVWVDVENHKDLEELV